MEEMTEKRFLSKGKRSIVSIAKLGKRVVVVKEERPESKAINRMENEGKWLTKLNQVGIGPKVHSFSKDFVVMDYVPGDRILDWIGKHSRKEVMPVLLEILKQCRKLDRLGVNKEEMHNPYKHILIKRKAIMIDFERARHVKSPQNVSQFCQFLMSAKVYLLLAEKKIFFDKESLIDVLKEYKRKNTDANFKRVLKSLDL